MFRPASAAVAFLAVSTANNGAGNTSISLTEPTGTTSNDVMIAVISVRGGTGTSVTAPSGWQLVDSRDSTTVLKSQVYYGVRAVVGAGPYDFTFASQKASAVVTSYSGVDVVNPVDIASGQANASDTVSTAPSITTTQANTMLVGAYSTATGTTYSSSAMTYHSGIAASTGAGAGTRTTTAMQDASQAVAGASGTKTLTFGAGAVNIGHLVALKPAASISQVKYRFFTNANSTTPGAALAASDTQAVIETGTPFRLRLNLGVSTSEGSLSAGRMFKLQYALSNGACDTGFAGETYADILGNTPVRFYDNASPADQAAYATTANDPTRSGITSVGQSYEEGGSFPVVTTTPSNQDALWDFALTTSGTTQGQQYCIRAINNVNGSYYPLEGGYTSIPSLLIPTPTLTQANYRWFANADSAAPGAALAAQDTSTSVAVSAPFRLRQRIAVDTTFLGASGQNFKLQYAEKSGVCDVGFSGETYTDASPIATQTLYAASATNVTGTGTIAWTTPGDAAGTENEGYWASSSASGSNTFYSNWLKGAYNFSVPTNATINGIEVVVKADRLGGGVGGYLDKINLVRAGTIESTGKTDTVAIPNGGFFVNRTYGGPSDLWGASWAPSDINSSSFGVAVASKLADGSFEGVTVDVDAMSITVYYAVPNTSPIMYYDNTSPADATTISSSGNDPTNSGRTAVYQTYRETDAFTNSVAAIPSGQDGMWDFALTSNVSGAGKTYCTRIVKTYGSLLDTYTNIPEITFASSGSPTLEQQTRGGGAVIDGVKHPFSW